MYCTCPSCGRTYHLRLAPEYTDRAWIAEFAPDTKPGEIPRSPCFECWKKSGRGGPLRDGAQGGKM